MMKSTRLSLWTLFCLGLALLGLVATNSAAAAPQAPLVPSANGILFIESNVEDYQRLAAEASPSLEVVVLDAQKDGLQQIATALTGRNDVPAVHLISHGSSGTLNLGRLSLNREALHLRHQDLATIRRALSSDAELLLYGCHVAQGSEGRIFVSALSEALAVQVAASINATGDGPRGGDWNLEHRTTGAMRTVALAFPSYAGLLPSVSGTVAINNPGDWVNYGTTLNDSESDNGDIAGISYDLFFGDSSGNPTGTVATFNNGLGSVGTVLILDTGAGAQTNESSYSFIAKSQMGKFRLTSFLIQDYYGMNSNYLATPYLNGAPSGAAYPFTIAQSGGYARTVMLPAQFNSVTEVRITSDGGAAPQPGARNIWQGFNNFVFADPILNTNADLAGLALSSVSLTPGFAAGTTSYTASVGNATASITVSPSVWDANRATVTVNGVSVNSGNASGAIALNVGPNTITTVVTAEDGSTTKTYTITVTRAAPPSSNANLSALALSSGTLAPVFASGTTSYTASVSNATTTLTVTPTVADSTASITVNGVATTNGNASGGIVLAVGNNFIQTVVTAQDGSTQKTYNITVTRAGSANADLYALSLSSGTLMPAFASGSTSYTASVSNATTSITATPTLASAAASVTVNGMATTSGNASGPIALAVGSNTITTVVTAQDGTTVKTYTITVTRAASPNNNLSALSSSSGTLSPPFAPNTTGYTFSIGAGVSSITITSTVADSTASLTLNGVPVSSGVASGAIAMNPGSNTVTVDVTAQNGATKTYTLTVTRGLPSSNAALSALSLSSGTLSPAFASGTTSYTASVANATMSLTVTPTLADATASVTVNGVVTTSGNASGAIALAVGANTINVVATAEDGTTVTTYTVTVTRSGSGDANLSALVLSGGSLSPAFAPATTSYTMATAASTGSITVTPTVTESNATVTVNGVAVASGSPSGPIAMNTGSNTVTTVVTAQNGSTKTYTVTVTRAISTNNDLAALTLSSGTLSPVFSSAQQTYSASVPNANTSITVTPTVADSSASVTVNGVAVSSGAPSGAIALNTGVNLITVTVTAQNGSPRSYNINMTRANRPTTTSGVSPSGGGTVTATLSGPAGCGFDRAAFIGVTGSPGSPPSAPSNYTFAQGLFDVEVGGCPTSATVTITLVYPQPFAPGSVYMKYGPTPSRVAPHWHRFPGAVISGNTVTLTLTDGGSGDADLVANGLIRDPGGVALALAAVGIPTLSQWTLILLSLSVFGAGLVATRRLNAGFSSRNS